MLRFALSRQLSIDIKNKQNEKNKKKNKNF